MKFRALTLCALSAVVTISVASSEEPKPEDQRLREILDKWREANAEATSMYAEFTVTTKDEVWQKTTKSNGSARYVAPNCARIDRMGDNAVSLVETSEGDLWYYKVDDKQITVYERPQKDASEASPIIAFSQRLSDPEMDAEISIVDETDETVRIRFVPSPKTPSISCFSWRSVLRNLLWLPVTDFKEAELTLNKTDWKIERYFVRAMNEDTVTYDFTTFRTDLDMKPTDFDPVRPDGWRLIRMEAGD